MKDKAKVKKIIKEYSQMTIGVMLVALSYSFFLDPNNLDIGGVGGIAIILKQYMNTSLVIFVLNVILLVFAYFLIGKEFFLRTIYGSLTYPLFTFLFDLLYDLLVKVNNGNPLIPSSNMLLITIFSAFVMGVGLGIAVKHGGSTGGTEIPQAIALKYFHIPYSASLFMFDGVIVFLGFLLLRDANGNLQFDYLLYAIIFIYLSGNVMDQIVFRGFNKRAVYIISEKNEEIKQTIMRELERGVTEIKVVGGYTNTDRTKLVCVLSSSQYYKLKSIINEVDPKAFYYVVRANEVGGEGFTYE